MAQADTKEMQAAVNKIQEHGQSSLKPAKPDCDRATQSPSAQQCLDLEAPPTETFCPRDMTESYPLHLKEIITARIEQSSEQLRNGNQSETLIACSLQNTKLLRSLSLKKAASHRSHLKRLIAPHLAKSSTLTLEVLKKLGELQRYSRETDPALTLVIAERESGDRGFQGGSAMVDTVNEGGINSFASFLPKMRRSIPPAYRGHWTTTKEPVADRNGKLGIHGLIPRNELVLAYGSFINHRYLNFRYEAGKLGIKKAAIDSLSSQAKKAWQALFFASDSGLPCKKAAPDGKCEFPKSAKTFGGMTALTYLVKNGHSLEDILTNPDLATYVRARMAVEASQRAVAVERLIGMKCPRL